MSEGKQAWVEQRAARRTGQCCHFNGIQHQTCKVGVVYDTLSSPLPCLQKTLPHKVCTQFKAVTAEEAKAEAVEILAVAERNLKITALVRQDAESKGYGRGNGGVGDIACPVCGKGTIRYSVASVNGHIWAACTVKGCFSVMQ